MPYYKPRRVRVIKMDQESIQNASSSQIQDTINSILDEIENAGGEVRKTVYLSNYIAIEFAVPGSSKPNRSKYTSDPDDGIHRY